VTTGAQKSMIVVQKGGLKIKPKSDNVEVYERDTVGNLKKVKETD
jgi:hypothetical protein